MDLKEVIKSLADASGVSGDETEAAKFALSYLKEFTNDCYVKNNCVFFIKVRKSLKAVYDADLTEKKRKVFEKVQRVERRN